MESTTTTAAIQLLIVPPEPDVAPLLAGGQQKALPFETIEWIAPIGTTREGIGGSSFATFWRVTLPDRQRLLEVHVPSTGLSVLYNIDPDSIDSQQEPHIL